jgi:predicted benzoate:H+ symporter BenE
LVGLFGHLEDLICKSLESVAVPGLVLSLGVENADPIQETFKLSQPGLVIFVAMQPLYIVHGAVHLHLLVVTLRGARLI